MSRTIFFSWQSDLSNNHHRSFIETCIKKALKNLSQDDFAHIYMDYDRDTLGRNGSPDISEVIFEKIERSILFICDISIVTGYNEDRKSPNPNVLIELGYAAKQLGWERVICFFDENTGTVEELPFDLRQKRIMTYNPENPDEKKRVTAILEDNIKALFAGGKLFNPLNDYMKGRIDKNLLEVCKQLSNILYGTASMSDGLARTKDFLSMDGDAIRRTLEHSEFHGFVVLNDQRDVNLDFQQILKELLSSNYFSREWAYTVIEAIDWIRRYCYFISKRNPNYPLEQISEKECDNFAAILGTAINQSNPPNSYIVLEVVNKDGKRYVDNGGKVVNHTSYPIDRVHAPDPFKKYFSFKGASIERATELFVCWSEICSRWLDATDSEFILDPDYYYIV